MSRIFHLAFRHSNFLIALTAIMTVFWGYYALQVKIDPSAENLIPEHNEVTELLEKYGSSSSSTGYFLIAVESENLFNIERLNALEKAIGEVSRLPGIEPGINPFSTFTFTKKANQLVVNTMAPGGTAPKDEEALQIFKSNLKDNPFYTGSLISKNGKILCLIFPCRPLTNEAAGFMADYEKIKIELEKYFKVYTSGDVPISEQSNQYIMRDLFKLFGFAILFMLASFYFGFRSKRAFILPLSVVLIGTLWTIGFMSLLGFQVNIISLIIPPLVLTIGSSYTIHILNQYYSSAEPEMGDMSWIVDATSRINKTILLASLTTVVGFISLLFTSLSQTKEFGLSTSFGIISTMLLSLFYLPAVLSKFKSPTAKQKENVKSGPFARFMGLFGLFVVRFRVIILILFGIIIALFIYAYPRVPAQSDYLSYFPVDDPVVNETSYIIENVGGYQTLQITMVAPDNTPRFFLEPEILKKISSFEQEIIDDPDITAVSSVAFYLRELNNLMCGKNEIPATRGLISLLSRYLKILRTTDTSNDLLSRLCNDEFSQITITLNIYNNKNNRILAEEALRTLIKRIDRSIETHLSEYSPEMWSVDMRYLHLSEILTNDQEKSTLAAIILVLIISTIAFKSLRYGLLTLTPLACGLMLNFIFMAFMQIPLDMITMMVTSIVIGVGVDDAIHYNIRFRKNYLKLGNVTDSIKQTHIEAGRPIMHTTVSIVGGLMFLLLSNFLGIAYFGLLICFTLTFTMIGTLVLLPAIITISIKNKEGRSAN